MMAKALMLTSMRERVDSHPEMVTSLQMKRAALTSLEHTERKILSSHFLVDELLRKLSELK